LEVYVNLNNITTYSYSARLVITVIETNGSSFSSSFLFSHLDSCTTLKREIF
jgi:hypothetical protein